MARLDAGLRKSLLQRARAAIARAVGAEPLTPVADPIPNPQSLIHSRVEFCAGAFVTLRLGGELRGCVGYPESERPLIEVVERCAVSAAISDTRFPAVTLAEWSSVDLEISVLGMIEAVRDIADVEVGRHGLIVELGRRRGLLLPQVAAEWKWSAARVRVGDLRESRPGDETPGRTARPCTVSRPTCSGSRLKPLSIKCR